MTNIQPVSRPRHTHLRWKRVSNYRFASATAVVPLAAAEVSHAALALPLAFVEREGHWALAAVMGFLPGQNLYVDADGKWLAAYVPAAFRGFPFLIGTQAGGEATLCVDEGSGLVVEGAEGETFFTGSGELSPPLAQVLNFLSETTQSEAILIQACDVLNGAGVIEPWPITVESEQGSQQVVGLYRINEATLNGLDDATHVQLRRNGVLGLAYAQLLSIGNLAGLGRMAQARAQAEAAERARAEVKPMITLPEDNTIDWDWSKIGR